MQITVLSASFRTPSLTLAIAELVSKALSDHHDAVVLDATELGALPLVGCDASGVDPIAFNAFEAALSAADAVILGMPLYRASISGAGKGLIDVFGDHLAGKPLGIFVAAGGLGAQLAVTDLDRPLALDLGCAVSPQRLLITDGTDPENLRRTERFVERFERFAEANRLQEVLSA